MRITKRIALLIGVLSALIAAHSIAQHRPLAGPRAKKYQTDERGPSRAIAMVRRHLTGPMDRNSVQADTSSVLQLPFMKRKTATEPIAKSVDNKRIF